MRVPIHGFVLLCFCLLTNASATGAIVHVTQSPASQQSDGQSWATAFSTLQAGIAMATPGDEVWVAAGTYRGPFVLKEGVALYGGFAGNESIRSQRNWMTHKSALRGAIPDDGGGALQAISLRLGVNDEKLVVVPPNTTSATRIDGFTIRDARASFGGGIYSGGGSPVIANNTIAQNTATGILGGGGIFFDTARELALQTPLIFFTNVVSHLFQAESPALRFDQIQIHPTNQYTAEVHRLLQVAANLYDATTNRGTSYPYYPSVFRPVFTNNGAAILISGFIEATDASFVTNRWLDLELAADRQALADDFVRSNANVFGQPIVIGAKKGYPNFNEFALQTTVQIKRLVELRKRSPLDRVASQTNQMLVVSISNLFGVEAWNSYDQIFMRPLRLLVTNRITVAVIDEFNRPVSPTCTNFTIGTNLLMSANTWGKRSDGTASFSVPLLDNRIVLDSAAYFSRTTPPGFTPYGTNLTFEVTTNYSIPQWTLAISNQLQYVLIDTSNQNRVVDFVNLAGLVSRINITRELMMTWYQDFDYVFWAPDILNGVPRGIRNQIRASQGEISADWTSDNFQPIPGIDRVKAIKRFREFTGLDPSTNLLSYGIAMNAPYTPARNLLQNMTWQANDPLVHYTIADLTDLRRTNNIQFFRSPFRVATNSNLGQMNPGYHPWGGNPFRTFASDRFAFEPAVIDPGILESDDWDFPAERVVNLRWLDRIHRGTPWQTIYFGLRTVPTQDLQNWSGRVATSSTNDWRLIARFIEGNLGLETSVNPDSEPAIINNTIAANHADGEGAGVYFSPDAAPTFANNIVAMNSSGIFKTGFGTPGLRSNCVFGNTVYDYDGLNVGARDRSVDPKFVSLQVDNLDLLATSPCLDAGDDSVIGSWLWADESARKFAAHIDIGAYELSPQAAPVLVLPIIDGLTRETKLELIGFDGQRYQIEASTNLFDWQPLEAKLTIGGRFELIDLEATNFNHRFYRAVKAP
jgi:hypothetical protein